MANLWLTGAGEPTLGTGEQGDYYRDTVTNLVYYRENPTTWAEVPAFTPSPDGVGTTWLYGTGAPLNGLGSNGNYYFDNDVNTVYFKVLGAWEAKGSLDFIGVYGVQWGNGTGAPANIPPLNNLPAGSFYLDVATSDIYYKNPSLVWEAKGQLGLGSTGLDAIATAADRVQTGLDRVATAADSVATAADSVATAADAVATTADRVQTGLDRVQTTADAATTIAARDAALAITINSAYVDFTTQANGAPLSVLDTGQAVDYTFNASGRAPTISGGRLIVNNQAGAGSGSLADYYQCNLNAPIVRVGAEWTQPSGADDGNGNATIVAWDSIYEGGGTTVARSWFHMSIVPGTGAIGTAKWSTGDGAGNLLNVKSQTFTNPPADGVTVWRCEGVLDKEAGIAFAWLPDGSIMRLTDAEIAAFCIAVSKPIQSLKNLDSKVMVIEHFCLTGANTASFAGFKNVYAETASPQFKLRSDSPLNLAYKAWVLKALVPPIPVGVSYAPTTPESIVTTTSAANINSTSGKFSCTAGPSGIVIVVASAYYEWSATDTLFWRLAGTVNTTTRAAEVGVSGQKRVVTQTIIVSGLTPGATITETLQHWTVSNGSATCKIGGVSSTILPALTLLAIPA